MTDAQDSGMSADGEHRSVNLRKSGVQSAELATAFWSDVLRFVTDRMRELDADTYEIEVEVTIRNDE